MQYERHVINIYNVTVSKRTSSLNKRVDITQLLFNKVQRHSLRISSKFVLEGSQVNFNKGNLRSTSINFSHASNFTKRCCGALCNRISRPQTICKSSTTIHSRPLFSLFRFFATTIARNNNFHRQLWTLSRRVVLGIRAVLPQPATSTFDPLARSAALHRYRALCDICFANIALFTHRPI